MIGQLTMAEVSARIDSQDELVIIDVRGEKKFNKRHIKPQNKVTVINIPLQTEQDEEIFLIELAQIDFEEEVIVYGFDPIIAKKSAQLIYNEGYTDVSFVNQPFSEFTGETL